MRWRKEHLTHFALVAAPMLSSDSWCRHRAVCDAATAQVTVSADQDSVRAAKVTAVFIKRCRTILTERCHYIGQALRSRGRS